MARFALFRFVGYGLKCYVCASAKDWASCDESKKEFTCPAGLDSCGKVYYDAKVGDLSLEAYGKLCTVKSACSDDLCKAQAGGQSGITIDKCKVDCCQDDLCNGAKVPLVSAFLLLACAVVALFR